MMKTFQTLGLFLILVNIACKQDNQTTKSIEKETKTTQTLQLGNHQMSYNSQNVFTLNEATTLNIKNDKSVLDGGYYNLNTSSENHIIGLNYQKLNNIIDLDFAIDNVVKGYNNIKGASLFDNKLYDVSEEFGMKAKTARGLINFEGESINGEYVVFAINTDNTLILIQGLFMQTGDPAINEFLELLKSIKIK